MSIYWVDPVAGNDSHAGGLGTPWATPNPFWAVAAPDDTLMLEDGTLTGSLGMLTPTTGLSGTSGHPISILALNDGGVLIDGEGVRLPCRLLGSSWWVLEGFNTGNSYVNGSEGALELDSSTYGDNTTGSHHNICRRIVAFNGSPTANSQVFECNYSNDNLIEDCAFFGTGRKMVSIFHCLRTTVRRCWGQFSGNTSGAGPQLTYTNYSSYFTRFENCIGTWDEDIPGYEAVDPYCIMGAGQMTFATDITGGPGTIFSSSIYDGCIAYHLSSQKGYMKVGGFSAGGYVDGITYNNCITFNGHAVDSSPYSSSRSVAMDYLRFVAEFGNSTPASQNYFNNITAINANTYHEPIYNNDDLNEDKSYIYADWQQNNVKHGLTMASVYGSQSLWNNDGTVGALIDFRIVDGVKTTTPLFPWPMEDRIFAAMTAEGSLTPRSVNTDVYSFAGVPDTVIPGGLVPTDDFSSYTTGTPVEGGNGGLYWSGPYVKGDNGGMTFETSPAGGPSAKCIRSSSAAGEFTYYNREFSSSGGGVSAGVFKVWMHSTITNPDSDFYGVSLHESGVNIKAIVKFGNTGFIEAYDYLAETWVQLSAYVANTWYLVNIEIDASGQPDAYRASVGVGSFSSWMGTNFPLSVVNLLQFNDFATGAHTISFGSIGSSGSIPHAPFILCKHP